MLLGTWDVTLDEAGNLTLPIPLRPLLFPSVVVTRGFERCLHLCPEPFWRGLARRVSSLSLSGADERWLRRLLFADAHMLAIDEQATIALSESLRRYATLERYAVLVGMDQYLEVWSPERWQECQATLLANAGRWSHRDWTVVGLAENGFSL
ncbi:division/cell wall cluster transcriptional repressor MraZ [Chloroflexus sp.]|uniref:division/cell wall cluster transcriptional repressor MraZ n=1 Tax=Chloroflexus sp. TaxID=1904827 RepID=UPI00404B0521